MSAIQEFFEGIFGVLSGKPTTDLEIKPNEMELNGIVVLSATEAEKKRRRSLTQSNSLTMNFDMQAHTTYKKWEATPKRSRHLHKRTIDCSGGHVSSHQGISLDKLMRGKIRMPEFSDKSVISQHPDAKKFEQYEYPGWGGVYSTTLDVATLPPVAHKHQLDMYRSTSISGNDLLASVLYTTGLCAGACGQLAPIAMILTCLALYPYRKIFQECGTAIPLNGGVYVAILNSSTKITATFAASCSLISYSATAVVSAAASFGNFPELPVTIAIMGVSY